MKNEELHAWEKKVSGSSMTKKEKCKDLKKNKVAYKQYLSMKKKKQQKCKKLSEILDGSGGGRTDSVQYHNYLNIKTQKAIDARKEKKRRCDEKKDKKPQHVSIAPMETIIPDIPVDDDVSNITVDTDSSCPETPFELPTKKKKVTKKKSTTKKKVTKKKVTKKKTVTKKKSATCLKVVHRGLKCKEDGETILTVHVRKHILDTLGVKPNKKIYLESCN